MEPVPIRTRMSTSATRGRGLARRGSREGVAAVGPGEQAEGEQQRERAEARHHDIDVARAHIPRSWSCAMTSAQDDSDMNSQANRKVKASSATTTRIMRGEEQRIERQHALRRPLVLAVAERVEAGGGAAEIDHDQEERGERVEAEMRAEPWQPDGQDQGLGGDLAEAERTSPIQETKTAKSERSSIEEVTIDAAPASTPPMPTER